jgi:sugar lactone lactonase YvrE
MSKNSMKNSDYTDYTSQIKYMIMSNLRDTSLVEQIDDIIKNEGSLLSSIYLLKKNACAQFAIKSDEIYKVNVEIARAIENFEKENINLLKIFLYIVGGIINKTLQNGDIFDNKMLETEPSVLKKYDENSTGANIYKYINEETLKNCSNNSKNIVQTNLSQQPLQPQQPQTEVRSREILASERPTNTITTQEARGAQINVDGVRRFFYKNGKLYYSSFDNKIYIMDIASGIVRLLAGNGTMGFSGDGNSAISAAFNFPQGIAVDSRGNVYIADCNNHRIRRVNTSTSVVTTVAGTGVQGFSGDGEDAIRATLRRPSGVAVDNADNLYIADTGNQRIRRVAAATGTITTFAGNGTAGLSGDGAAALSASFRGPADIVIDGGGNMYISDSANNRIRRIAADTQRITTVAGTGPVSGEDGQGGNDGDGGPATRAKLHFPNGLALESNGNLIIADTNNYLIRRLNTSTQVLTTLSGNIDDGDYNGEGILAIHAQIREPYGVAVDNNGNIYIAESSHSRKVNASNGMINNLVGYAPFTGGRRRKIRKSRKVKKGGKRRTSKNKRGSRKH